MFLFLNYDFRKSDKRRTHKLSQRQWLAAERRNTQNTYQNYYIFQAEILDLFLAVTALLHLLWPKNQKLFTLFYIYLLHIHSLSKTFYILV